MRSRDILHSSLRPLFLLSEVKLVDDRAVTLDISLLKVAKKVSSVTNHLEKSATAVMVLVIGLEMLGQIVDSVSKKRDLNLRRTGIALVSSILLNNSLLFVFHHDFSPFCNICIILAVNQALGV